MATDGQAMGSGNGIDWDFSRLPGSCRHEYVDIYTGTGPDKDDPYLMHTSVFCKFCLDVRVLHWRQDKYKLNEEFLDGYQEETGEAA